MNSFLDKLNRKWTDKKFVCVGLDPEFEKLPDSVKESSKADSVLNFNKQIIDSTADLVCAYKIQSAFFEALGDEGHRVLKETTKYILKNYPDVAVILDAKRGDIGNSNLGYTQAVFEDLNADAVTVHPYLGKESLQPFLDYQDKGIIVLVRTSNPGAGEFQDLEVEGKPLYQVVAEHISKEWNDNGNCAVVVGATYPEELKKVREIIGEDMPILIPGIGAQGGDLETVVKNGINSKGTGIIISASRSIIYAPSPKEATLKLHEDILKCLK